METSAKASRALTGSGLASVLSLAALATLTACAGPGGPGGTTVEVGLSSHSQPVPAAPPGRYQTLPEACGAVGPDTLRALLPNSSDYGGESAPTYDIDRRVGCRWSGSVPAGDRILSIDMERVVSYDPSVSDNDRAAQDFAKMAQAAHVPSLSPGTAQSASPSTAATSSPPPSQPASAAPSSSTGTGTDAATGASPRRVGGVGDEAYLDDDLVTQDTGTHRDVTFVFRTANVLVTIVLSQWPTDASAIPPSADLQSGADGVAQEVMGQFD